VADPNTVRRIARLSGVGAGDRVVEIGPGLGSLTLALAETGAEVVAVEADDRLLPVLGEVLAGAGVRVVHGDALAVDWNEVLGPDDGRPWSLVANLPYNVAATIVLELLDTVPRITRMLVMVQKEVGERLAAPAGSGAYGIPSVKLAYRATASVAAQVPATVFVPRPRVASVLVAVERRSEAPTPADPEALFALVRRAFNQRRKMLRRSLAGVATPEAFAAAGIDPSQRPEELDVVAWGRLTMAVAATGTGTDASGASDGGG
jgi:16S rRNA (adenine1518-N6/adenine1519-N6)-dimethyltransferase